MWFNHDSTLYQNLFVKKKCKIIYMYSWFHPQSKLIEKIFLIIYICILGSGNSIAKAIRLSDCLYRVYMSCQDMLCYERAFFFLLKLSIKLQSLKCLCWCCPYYIVHAISWRLVAHWCCMKSLSIKSQELKMFMLVLSLLYIDGIFFLANSSTSRLIGCIVWSLLQDIEDL